jgi:hypothetical protein
LSIKKGRGFSASVSDIPRKTTHTKLIQTQGMPMWGWIQTLSQGGASFIGSLTGGLVGLIALLLGALFNAHLNRRRDDRLRGEDRRTLAAALRAELAGIAQTLENNAAQLKKGSGDFIVPDVAHSVRVLPKMLPKIGLLDPETISKVIDAHIVIEQYCEQLTMRGGQLGSQNQTPNRRLIAMPADKDLLRRRSNYALSPPRLSPNISGCSIHVRYFDLFVYFIKRCQFLPHG